MKRTTIQEARQTTRYTKGRKKAKARAKRLFKAKLVALIKCFTAMALLVTVTLTMVNNMDVSGNINKKQKSTDGIYTFTDSTSTFRILQVTDMHITGIAEKQETDQKAFQAVRKLVEYANPNLIIITGDFVFGTTNTKSEDNALALNKILAFMDEIGIPWTFALGNHDHDFLDRFPLQNMDATFATSTTLIKPNITEGVDGYSNQVLKLRNANGTLNTAIMTIDTNSYIAGDDVIYDGVHDNQIEWYKNQIETMSKEEGNTVSSLLFMHIPMIEYNQAWNLYKAGSSEVQYYYGVKGENVTYSKNPTSLFDTIVSCRSTTGVFCGHDHTNYYSIKYRGIRLTYGMSIDYIAYTGIDQLTDQRGATSIEISADGSYTVTPIRLSDIE